MEEFNQQEYINKYTKEHYRSFCVRLHKELYEQLEKKLKKKNITKATFLKKAIEDFLKSE